MRNALIQTLLENNRKDRTLYFITGDLGFMAVEPLKEHMQERFINAGVAEANIIGLAAGLAKIGFRPFVYSMASFITMRCLEHIRVSLCQHNSRVVIIGVGSGYSYGNQGVSHHAIEDLAGMIALPGMTVIVPGDPFDVENAVKATDSIQGPVYIRLAKAGEPNINYKEKRDFRLGRFSLVRNGEDGVILGVGEILGACVEVAGRLAEKGFSIAVYNCHTLKPFDMNSVLDIASKTKTFFTVEQHVVHGGLASLVALTLARNSVHLANFYPFHIRDMYADCCGSKEYLEDLDGLSPERMYVKMLSILQRSRL